MIEKRALQVVVAIACLVPLLTGAESIVRGAAWMAHAPVSRDLDSHFRYVSGIFFALGVAFTTCVPAIERKGPRFRMLGAMVVCGGLARVVSLLAVGAPSGGHLFGLGMELGVVPLLMGWQLSIEKRRLSSPALREGLGEGLSVSSRHPLPQPLPQAGGEKKAPLPHAGGI